MVDVNEVPISKIYKDHLEMLKTNVVNSIYVRKEKNNRISPILCRWNGNSFFDKFYKVQNFFPYAIPIVLDNEPRM